MEYQPRKIERKWQQQWKTSGLYRVSHMSDRPKFYVLDMFPYPSGAGLHVGHPLGYIASDIFARYKRMQGYNVLHPMGFDAFGLPAEQYAIQTGVHPAVSTATNIARFKEQLDNIGFSYDWEREIRTCDPSYYKWTQWIFLQLFEHYYDLTKDRALPVADLVARLERSGTEGLRAACTEERTLSAAAWKALDAREKQDFLMNYRLAYRTEGYVNWCEALGTVLANDEVKDGVSERGGYPVVRKPMLQWSLRITAYAERLLNDLDTLDWTDSLKQMQRNWIGKSTGALVWFPVQGINDPILIFTTRPDTIFGATFLVLAPEHDQVDGLTTAECRQAVDEYRTYVQSRTERDRLAETRTMTGTFTGAYAIHPFTGERIPIWISEYVLKDYGTGAIMAVPSDDDRDHQFARTFGLPIIDIIDKSAYPEAARQDKVGIHTNSGFLNGLDVSTALDTVIRRLGEEGKGLARVQYKLRDANFSRQRYWGEPFPVSYDDKGLIRVLSPEELPLELPDLDQFQPSTDGRSPLSRVEPWLHAVPGWTRETDTMPGFAGSSWYFLRFMDPDNAGAFVSPEAVKYWKDVDLYIGGTEHAVGHLLYARFWHKFFFDKGWVPTPEPFRRLINQGMIQGVIESLFLSKEKQQGKSHFVCLTRIPKEDRDHWIQIPVDVSFVKNYGLENSGLDAAGIRRFLEWRKEFGNAIFTDASGRDWSADSGTEIPEDFFLKTLSEVGKMSKSKFNVINPDDVVAEYGADCFRMYEMFLGPLEQSKPWDTKGIDGVSKFLKRVWSLFYNESGQWQIREGQAPKAELRILHTALKKVSQDLERFSFNTCVSAFMICVNEWKKGEGIHRESAEAFVRLLSPFAPHLAEELWEALGHLGSVCQAEFPAYDETYLQADEVEYPVCINGKKRAALMIGADATQDQIRDAALALPDMQKWLEKIEIGKVIIVPGRMVNVVGRELGA